MFDRVTETRTQKWGWSTLIVVSAMLVVNGMGWFFVGPGISLSNIEQGTGLSALEFEEAYPAVAANIIENARQVAIWFMAFGFLSLRVALEGLRHGSQWAWINMWILVAALASIGVNVLASDGSTFGIGVLGVAAISLVGQLLASRGLAA